MRKIPWYLNRWVVVSSALTGGAVGLYFGRQNVFEAGWLVLIGTVVGGGLFIVYGAWRIYKEEP